MFPGKILALSVGLSSALACNAAPKPVRVVLVTLDTLRYDQLEPAEGATSAMPHTWARAQQGLRFSRFYTASPVTQPTHATLFTGLHPWQHGVTRNGQVLSDDLPHVAEILRDRGFATAAVVASFPLAARFGFGRGFDSFREEFSLKYQPQSLWEEEWDVPGGEFFSLGGPITDLALLALDAAAAGNQFFWFHYFDPHSPYGDSQGLHVTRRDVLRKQRREGAAAADAMLERGKQLYAEDVAYLDQALERLFERLYRDGVAFDTHVFVVSDHGESFGEGGSLGHGFRLTEEQIHVPAFVVSPRVEPGVRSEVASSLDVARTLLSLAGVAADGLPAQGRDLTRPGDGDTRAYAMRKSFRGGVGHEVRLTGRHRLEGALFGEVDPSGRIRRGNAKGLLPGDERSLDASREERLIERFRSFEDQLPDPEAVESLETLDPSVERGLEALGYGS